MERGNIIYRSTALEIGLMGGVKRRPNVYLGPTTLDAYHICWHATLTRVAVISEAISENKRHAELSE